MPNTYTKIYIHIVFSIKGRETLISNSWAIELYKYITGIITNKSQKLIAINGMHDHIHILVGIKPDISISDLVRDIKSNSTNFINNKKLVPGKFSWQEGFAAFSYSESQIPEVAGYIEKQKEHHQIKTFQEEYHDFLKKFNIKYDEKYLFEFYK